VPSIQIYAFDGQGHLIETYRDVRGELRTCNPIIAEISVCTGVLNVRKAAALPKGDAGQNGYRVGLWESRPLIPKPIFKPSVLIKLLKKKIGAAFVVLGPRLGETSRLLCQMQVEALEVAAQYGWPVIPVPPMVGGKARAGGSLLQLKVKTLPKSTAKRRKATANTA
jgi:hypothetical protein